MIPATAPAAIGTIIAWAEDLAALPLLSVIMADPGGQDTREDERRLVLQLRADFGAEPAWYAAKSAAKYDLDQGRDADGQHYGPFLVIWLPPVDAAAEAAA